MSERDSRGRYIKGSKNTIEEQIKIMYSLQKSWKSRKDYIGDIRNKYPKIYNSWRACMFTKKVSKQEFQKIGKILEISIMMYSQHISKEKFLEDQILLNHFQKIISFG